MLTKAFILVLVVLIGLALGVETARYVHAHARVVVSVGIGAPTVLVRVLRMPHFLVVGSWCGKDPGDLPDELWTECDGSGYLPSVGAERKLTRTLRDDILTCAVEDLKDSCSTTHRNALPVAGWISVRWGGS